MLLCISRYPTVLINGKGRKERFVVLSDKTAQLETTRIYAKPSMEQMKTALESTGNPGGKEKAIWEGDEDAMARLCGLR